MRTRIARIRKIVDESQSATIEEQLMDLYSAGAYVAVYEKLSEDNQVKLEKMPLDIAMGVVWKLVTPGGVT